mmetsp:Transcript_114726/g.320605  ORF Transcript_114726/g.320605 Transcript_114726/m.320605 type:complete len:272 (-) Transcript_114726:94-909(-)
MGDKLVKTTAAKRLRASSSKFAWSARMCEQVDHVRAEMATLFASNAHFTQCAQWARVDASLQLSPLTSCMKSVARTWWKDVGEPFWAFCSAERFHPGEHVVSRVVPQLAVSASRLLPRLRRQLETTQQRCAANDLSAYEVRSCETLLAAIGDDFAGEEEQGSGSSLLPGGTAVLKWRIAALADDEWAQAQHIRQNALKAGVPAVAAQQQRPTAATLGFGPATPPDRRVSIDARDAVGFASLSDAPQQSGREAGGGAWTGRLISHDVDSSHE